MKLDTDWLEEHSQKIVVEAKLESLHGQYNVLKKYNDEFFEYVNDNFPEVVNRYFNSTKICKNCEHNIEGNCLSNEYYLPDGFPIKEEDTCGGFELKESK